MADRAGEARRLGLVPEAPAFVAYGVILGGLGGLYIGLWSAPLGALAARCFGLDTDPETHETIRELASSCLARPGLGLLGGALLGLALAELSLGAIAPALRIGWRPRGGPAWPRLAASPLVLLALALVASSLVWFEPASAHSALIQIPVLACLGGAALLLPYVLWLRASGRRRWHEEVFPEPPPRRDEDEPAPELRQALRDRPSPPHFDLVVSAPPYAAAIERPPEGPARLLRHGGPELLDLARRLGRPVVLDQALGHKLAGQPTGAELPEALVAPLRARDPEPPSGP